MRASRRRVRAWARRGTAVLAALGSVTCVAGRDEGKPKSGHAPRFPLAVLRDAPLPGAANRFDYQEIDADAQRLLVTHMNDDALVVLGLDDARVVKVLPGIPRPRGIAVSAEAARIFVTSLPSQLVIIDRRTLSELARVTTGKGPDGVAYDAKHQVVGVSDQTDGAISLLSDAGMGQHRQVPLGQETGNVVFDAERGSFWITVVEAGGPNRLVEIAPLSGSISKQLDLPGCDGAHGLRLHPDGQSAFVACEDNSVLLRVALDGPPSVARAGVGRGPDVLGVDRSLGWLYVAAESGELSVFDLARPGLLALFRQQIGTRAHSVAVDSVTHRAFFPLESAADGKPVLRITRPR